MKYTKFGHIINASLLIAIFAFPISECFINNRMPHNVGISIINLASLIVILLFLDFYKFKLTNKLNGIAFYLGLSVVTIASSLVLAIMSGIQISANMFFGENFQVWSAAWSGSYSAQVLYMLGISLFLTSIALFARFVLLNSVNVDAKSKIILATN